MDQHVPEHVIHGLLRLPSRRDVVRGLAGAGIAAVVGRWPHAATARKDRKPKMKRNAFGCVNVGDSCRNDGQCCSGLCVGKKGKRTCRDHDGGTGCRAGLIEDGCGGDIDVACTTSTGQPGICNTTTGNAGYCIGIAAVSAKATCTKDEDCRVTCGTEAAVCITCEGAGACAGPSNGDCNPVEM